MDQDGLLSGAEVAERLRLHPATVRRIPAAHLPYEETPGGDRRGGRRRYRPEDVEAYARGRTSSLDERVAELERWRKDVDRRLDG